jgi:hypothetical protein
MRSIRLLLAAGLLTAASLGAAAPGVAAYGQADQPLAQIEFSANCNNPASPICSPETGFGLGGIWLWIEIDAGGTADIAGSACGHDRAGSGGAFSIRGEFAWSWSASPQGFPATFVAPADPNDGYYNIAFGPDVLSFPASHGHYSAHPAPGVALELQVAP